jgi:ribosomal-protein-alanine N-acetyltransferase
MKISCRGCLLRPLELADADDLAHHANDPGVWQNLRDRFPHPYSVADAVAYIEHLVSRPAQTSFGIDVDGRAIGSITLMVGEDIARRSAEVGYWIGREYWGRGIMVDAVRATTKYAFEVLDLVRVFAVPFDTKNRKSRFLEKY